MLWRAGWDKTNTEEHGGETVEKKTYTKELTFDPDAWMAFSIAGISALTCQKHIWEKWQWRRMLFKSSYGFGIWENMLMWMLMVSWILHTCPLAQITQRASVWKENQSMTWKIFTSWELNGFLAQNEIIATRRTSSSVRKASAFPARNVLRNCWHLTPVSLSLTSYS